MGGPPRQPPSILCLEAAHEVARPRAGDPGGGTWPEAGQSPPATPLCSSAHSKAPVPRREAAALSPSNQGQLDLDFISTLPVLGLLFPCRGR